MSKRHFALRVAVALAAIVVCISGPQATAQPDVQFDGDNIHDGQGETQVRGHDGARVPGKYHGRVPLNTRESIEPYGDPIYDAPCVTIPGTQRPTSRLVSFHTGTPSIQAVSYAQTAAITATTPTFDPAKPPSFYFAVCQFAQPTPSPESDRQKATAWVADYFRRTAMPIPHPEISAKSGGICGVVHTVDLHMQPEFLLQESSTPFGPLILHTYGHVTLDWGDGNHNTYTDGGAPYPNSSIKHAWSTSGSYTIAARINWVANYTLGPYNGVTFRGILTGVQTNGSIDNFRVFDAQAVLTAPQVPSR